MLTAPSGHPDATIETGHVDAIDSEDKEASNLHKKIGKVPRAEWRNEIRYRPNS
jgi:hypothetical protein